MKADLFLCHFSHVESRGNVRKSGSNESEKVKK